MSTKSFLDQYQFERETVFRPGSPSTLVERYVIYAPRRHIPIAEVYEADDAQKIVDALNKANADD